MVTSSRRIKKKRKIPGTRCDQEQPVRKKQARQPFAGSAKQCLELLQQFSWGNWLSHHLEVDSPAARLLQLVHRVRVAGHQQNLAFLHPPAYLHCGLNAVAVRQIDVHNGDVGAYSGRQLDPAFAAQRKGRGVTLLLQHHRQGPGNAGLIVNDENRDSLFSAGQGIWTQSRTRVEEEMQATGIKLFKSAEAMTPGVPHV